MKSDLKPRTLRELSQAYIAKELRADPEYQRGLQWGVSQKQGLIDSLLRGYQIPIFYIHLESRKNNYTQAIETTAWIVDGQQRLASIVSYCQNEFALPDPKKSKVGSVIPVDQATLPSWTGKKFQDLEHSDKERLLNHELLVVELTAPKNEVRDLFIRLQSGTPLTAQEKRDAWPGDFTNFVIQHAGKPGHRLSSPKPFFTQFKKTNARRVSVSDNEHYVDGHADMRKFFAGLAMTIMLRERSNIDFVDLRGKIINDFYIANLDIPEADTGTQRVAKLLDFITELPNFEKLKMGSTMSFQMAFHLAVLVDTLSHGNYTKDWMDGIIDAFMDFKKSVAEARLHYRETRELRPHYERFDRMLSGSGSDTAEIIRMRHAFLLSEMHGKLKIKVRDEARCFDLLEREVIWNRDSGKCQNPYCARPNRSVPFCEATIHHIDEHCSGGATTLKNGILICPECHTDRKLMQELRNKFAEYIDKIYSKNRETSEALIPEDSQFDSTEEQSDSAKESIKIEIDWGELDINKEKQLLTGKSDAEVIIKLLGVLIETFGKFIEDQLKEIKIIRYHLSTDPKIDFLNKAKGKPYSYLLIPGTNLYFCPHSQRSEKIEGLKVLFSRLVLPGGEEFPPGAINIQ